MKNILVNSSKGLDLNGEKKKQCWPDVEFVLHIRSASVEEKKKINNYENLKEKIKKKVFYLR